MKKDSDKDFFCIKPQYKLLKIKLSYKFNVILIFIMKFNCNLADRKKI